jgi:hypothetical protein
MNDRDSRLERLLRAARGDDAAAEMPYGFDTRVVALARSTRPERNGDVRAIARLFRRIATGAVVVAVFAGAAAYWQLEENDELAEPSWNAYAIADNAIDLALNE